MRDELKSYIVQHNLSSELHDSVKDVLTVYGITEDPGELKISVSRKSESPKSSNKSEISSKKAAAIPASKKSGNLKPRSLNTDVNQKASNAGSRARVSSNKIPNKAAVSKENLKKLKKGKQAECEMENQASMENNPSEGSGCSFFLSLKKKSGSDLTSLNFPCIASC
jgi:hypothetical protein